MRTTESKDSVEQARAAFFAGARECSDPRRLRESASGAYFVMAGERAWGPYKTAGDAALDVEQYLRDESAIIVKTSKPG